MGYFGSKATSGLCQPIIAMMPPHDIYIETHLGGGAIMRRKLAALHNIGYPGAEVLFFTAAPVPPLTGATPETLLPRLPISRLSPEEIRGDPRCLGHPLRACRAQRPRRVRPPLAHLSVRSLLPSGCLTPWAPWKADSFRGCMAHGPLVRVPTHRRIRYRFRRKARYRPGGLTLGRAGFAPAG